MEKNTKKLKRKNYDCSTKKFKGGRGITLIALVITIVVLLILAGVSIATLTGDNGLLTKASEAKIMTALGAVKEEIELDKTAKLMENKNVTVEQLLADGKIKRTVQAKGETYCMYYAIKPEAYEGMQGLGKGILANLKDVFLIDDEFHVRYVDKSGKEYGDNINNKILEDETEIRFASKAFSEYVSRISGVTEEEMKFKWMKNQTSLTIKDSSIDNLGDLVFFPNLISLELGEPGTSKTAPSITTLDGIENCTKLTRLSIYYGPDKDYTSLASLSNLTIFNRGSGNDYDNIIDGLKNCNNLKQVQLYSCNIDNMKRIGELPNLRYLELQYNKIKKIEGLNNMTNLETLYLDSNEISKIEGLESLRNLKRLSLQNNQITDITPLSQNTSLTGLNLKGNTGIDGDRSNYTGEKLEALNKIGEVLDRGGSISLDVDKIGLFTNYKILDLSGQSLTTLEPIEGLTSLTWLSLKNNQLTLEDEKSKEILKSMENLNTLYLSNNKITDVTAINNLKNLITLDINGKNNNINLAEIEDIISKLDSLFISTESLKNITNCNINKITKLSINSCGLTEIPDLSKFTNLKNLTLYYNPSISDFSSISKLTSLKSLDIRGNKLHNKMIDFSKLTNLTNLNLSDNTLWTEDLENLKALKNNINLTINLSSNSIIDASALLVLDTSCKIDLRNNVNLTQESKDALKARFGSNVSF